VNWGAAVIALGAIVAGAGMVKVIRRKRKIK